MPHPIGAKTLYIPPWIMLKFPGLDSGVLQKVLERMDEWTAFLKLKNTFNSWIDKNDDLKDALEIMRII